MDFELPEELRLLQRTVRQFTEEVLERHSREVERSGEIPRALIEEMAKLGLFGLQFDEAYGGSGLGKLGYVVAVEQLARSNAAYWNVIGASAGLCGTAIDLDGSVELRRRYLPDIAAGKRLGAYALSEPGSGSDAASLSTTARRSGDEYVIEGQKTFITNAPIADVFVVFFTLDRSKGAKAVTAAVVERSAAAGLEIGRNDEKMGLHGSTIAQLFFREMRVPAANRIGEEGRGFATALKTLDLGRIGLAAHAVGAAQRLLEASVEHARGRKQFGRPIGANQAVQWMLADGATEIHAARLMTYDAAHRADAGERITQRAAMAKLFATEALGRVADAAVQVHGGMGYMRELWIERAYRDARITRLYEGTSEMQRLVIARALLDEAPPRT